MRRRWLSLTLCLAFGSGCSDELTIEEYASMMEVDVCGTESLARTSMDALQEPDEATLFTDGMRAQAFGASYEGDIVDFGFDVEYMPLCAKEWTDECGPTFYTSNAAIVTGATTSALVYPGESVELESMLTRPGGETLVYRVGLDFAGDDLVRSDCFNGHPHLSRKSFFLNSVD